jgi:predicted DNA-binding transcriptional regulator AlpA
MLNELITKKELHKMLDISKTTVFNWTKKKWLKPISIGSKVYYRKSDINDLLKKAYSGNGGTTNG